MKRVLILLLILFVLLAPASTRGQAGGRAGLVVLFSDGSVQSSCVSFESDSISSLELLQRSGLAVIAQVSGNNAAVCKIGDDGCDYPAETCFCKFSSGQQGQYWAFWQQIGGAWQYSAQGAASVRVRDGDVNGWAWGTGNVQSGAQPPLQTFDQICPAAAPTVVPPTPTPPTPAPPRPTARPTQRPALQPTPRPTSVPTEQQVSPSVTAVASALPASARPTPAPGPTIAPPTSTPPPIVTPAAATAPPTVITTALPTPTQPIAGAANAQRPRTSVLSYALFGAMLAAILGAILFVRRRRT